MSWDVCVVLVSEDPVFLTTFADLALRGRLLVWSTKLLLVTSVALQQLRAFLGAYWVFSMMNTVVVVLQNEGLLQKLDLTFVYFGCVWVFLLGKRWLPFLFLPLFFL